MGGDSKTVRLISWYIDYKSHDLEEIREIPTVWSSQRKHHGKVQLEMNPER